MKKLYLAYGSNMDMQQMAKRCPEARLMGKTFIEGYCLLFKGSERGVYATIEPEVGSKVPALVWELTENDERSLDEYERFPELYYKEEMHVMLHGKSEKAMAYIMDKSQRAGIPDVSYYKVLEEAYRQYGFPIEILEEA